MNIDVQLPYLGVNGYFEAYQRIRLSSKALLNYCLYVKARMMQVIDDEENRRLWEWIKRKSETEDGNVAEGNLTLKA